MTGPGPSGMIYTDDDKEATMAGTTNWSQLRDELVRRVGEDRLVEAELTAGYEQLAAEALEGPPPLDLADLRKMLGRSQVDVASALGVSQPEVSRVEHEADLKLSTLRAYIESLGGRLHLLAEVDGDLVEVDIPQHVARR